MPAAAWATLNASELSQRLVNDLEPAAFALQPNLAALRDRIEQDTKQPVRMSGSGSSLFLVADEHVEAAEWATMVQKNTGIRSLAVQLAPEIRIEPEEHSQQA